MNLRAGFVFLLASLLLAGCATDSPANNAGDDAGDTSRPGPTTPDAGLGDTERPDTPRPDASPSNDVRPSDITQPEDANAQPDATSQPDAAGQPDGTDTRDAAPQPDASDDSGTPQGQPGDTCETAFDATAGGRWEERDTRNAKDDYHVPNNAPNCPTGGNSTGRDEVYRVSPAYNTTYKIVVTPLEANFNPFIYVREDCSQDACIDGTKLSGPGQPESLTIDVPAGATYYIIVDGELVTSGRYNIDITMEASDAPEPSGDTCDEAIDATHGGVWNDRDTRNATGQYDAPKDAPNCPSGDGSGPEEVFRVSPTQATTYKVVMTPLSTSLQPLLYTRTDCTEDACVGGTVFTDQDGAASTTFTAQAGQTVYIFADGRFASSGPYTLEVILTN